MKGLVTSGKEISELVPHSVVRIRIVDIHLCISNVIAVNGEFDENPHRVTNILLVVLKRKCCWVRWMNLSHAVNKQRKSLPC